MLCFFLSKNKRICIYIVDIVLFLFRRNVSPNTVRSRLRAAGLQARRRKVTLGEDSRFTRRQWTCLLFGRIKDSTFSIWWAKESMATSHRWFSDACTNHYDRWGGGSFHIWAGVTQFNKTNLDIFDRNVNANTYINIFYSLLLGNI